MKKNVLLYGGGEAARQVYLKNLVDVEFNIVGVIDDNLDRKFFEQDIPFINLQDAQKIILEFDVSEVILLIPSLTARELDSIITRLKSFDVIIKMLPLSHERGVQVDYSDIKNISLEELIGRKPSPLDEDSLATVLNGSVILITGAGGSIGSQICKTISKFYPKMLILLDHSEENLFHIFEYLSNIDLPFRVVPVLGNCCDFNFLESVFEDYPIDACIHAAAYKHVDLVQRNVIAGFTNNVESTYNLLVLSDRFNLSYFTLVSSDKAVRPSNIMGATKRICELLVSHFRCINPNIKFTIVRFGNVIGSSGSVVPIFLNQIANGGPITVRDVNVVRYFMSIKEACDLVLQASAFRFDFGIFLLDMGEPVKIIDIAKQLIALTGCNEGQNQVEIVTTGLKPGEKLYEELLMGFSKSSTSHEKIFVSNEQVDFCDEFINRVAESLKATSTKETIVDLLEHYVEGFSVGN
jgi:UDP-N-acetylglucosamine 4,6-dehydratase